MNNEPQLHSSIIALVSLTSGIAAKHPDMGLCQLDKLRSMGVPESQINSVIEIARYIRDEASEKLDASFNEKSDLAPSSEASKPVVAVTSQDQQSCCSSTPGGQSCC